MPGKKASKKAPEDGGMNAYPLVRGRLRGGLAAAMYFVLVMESMSMAICLSKGIEYSHRTRVNGFLTDSHIALLIYLWLGFLGYLLTIPFLCLALHRHLSKFLVPYLLWRVLFTLMTIAIGITLGVLMAREGLFYHDRRVRLIVPPCVVQVFLGLVFIVLTILAMRQLKGGTGKGSRAIVPSNNHHHHPDAVHQMDGVQSHQLQTTGANVPAYYVYTGDPYGYSPYASGGNQVTRVRVKQQQQQQYQRRHSDMQYPAYWKGQQPYYGYYGTWKY